jgi:F0F1-type ATP synthase membrane subunit c/vacuolar-type H+-ATPase subunit K
MKPVPAKPATSAQRQLWLLWAGIGASAALYAAAFIIFASKQTLPTREPLSPLVRAVFVALGLGAAIGSFWWRRTFDSPASVADLTAMARDERAFKGQLYAKFLRHCLITWAIADTVAIFGLVLGLLANDFSIFAPFAAIALILFYLHRPSTWSAWPLIEGAPLRDLR